MGACEESLLSLNEMGVLTVAVQAKNWLSSQHSHLAQANHQAMGTYHLHKLLQEASSLSNTCIPGYSLRWHLTFISLNS